MRKLTARLRQLCIKPSECGAGKAKSLTYFKDFKGGKRGNERSGLTRALRECVVRVTACWQHLQN